MSNQIQGILEAVRQDDDDSQILFNPQITGKDMKEFPVANIASDLVPEAAPFVEASLKEGRHPRIRVVGFDGAYFEKPNNHWFSTLAKWTENGLDLTYLFTGSVCNEAITALQSLAKTGHVTVYKVRQPQPQFQKRLARWENFHFVLFDEPKQLWIEGEHLPEAKTATDCEYYSPAAVEKDISLFQSFSNRYDEVISSDSVEKLV